MAFGFGRIEFDGNFIDLKRPWTDFQPRRAPNVSFVQAESGVEQTIKKFTQYFINARLNLLDPQEKAALQRLFEYAEDGSTFTLIRDRDLGTYINFEGGINPTAASRGLKTNDDVDGTFTRTNVADSAWYLDEGTGLLTLRDGANVPRFPAGKYGSGILIEGARTNEIAAPSDFTTAWGGSITKVTTTETLDPAGTSDADKLTATATPDTMQINPGLAVGNDATFSVYLKSPSGNVTGHVQLSGTTAGGPTIQTITVTPEWPKVPFKVTADTSGWTGNVRAEIQIDTSGEIMYGWGAQLEDSALFASRIIGAASASSTTRNAERLLFPTTDIIDQNRGTVSFLFKPEWSAGSGPQAWLFTTSGGTDEYLKLLVTAAGSFNLALADGTGSAAATISVASGLVADTFHRITFTYDVTISNGCKLYLDGAQIGSTSSNSPFNPRAIGANISIGSRVNGTFQAFGTFEDVLVLKNVLSDREVADFENLNIGLGIQRNRWTVRLANPTWNPQWLHSDVYDIPLLFKEVIT